MKKQGDISSFVEDEAFAKEASIGSQVLTDKDQQVTQAANFFKKVISYSLFGAEPGYCEGAIINAQVLTQIYPDWEMWVFYDASVPYSVTWRLQGLGVKVWDVAELGIQDWPGTFWRFYAVCMPDVQYSIFRDVDSILSLREKVLIDEWLASGKPFHVIRDWYSHQDLILAGLWGAYAPLLGNMKSLVSDYIRTQYLHPTHADQEFLAACIWPRIRPFMLEHDSIHHGRDIVAFAPPAHVNTGQEALGGYRYKKLEISIAQTIDMPYGLVVIDENNEQVFRYQTAFKMERTVFNCRMNIPTRLMLDYGV